MKAIIILGFILLISLIPNKREKNEEDSYLGSYRIGVQPAPIIIKGEGGANGAYTVYKDTDPEIIKELLK